MSLARVEKFCRCGVLRFYCFIPFDKGAQDRKCGGVFKRLCYLIAEGFEICSITGYDSNEEINARIMFRYSDTDGRFCLETELFHADPAELEACSNLFLDYLQSEGLG